MKKQPRIGLALGSGGARGFAHVALLEELHSRNTKIFCVAGSSMGAVVAAAYALQPDPQILKRMTRHFLQSFKERIRELIRTMEANVSLRKQMTFLARLVNAASLDQTDFLYSSLSRIFGEARFSDCKIPCSVVATSLNGEVVVLNEGYLVDAVAASAAVPGAFPPLRLGGRWLVDGGVLSVTPVDVTRQMGAELVIASHVGYFSPKEVFTDILDYAVYLDDIKGEVLGKMELENADLILDFRDIKVPWYRFDLAENIMEKAHQIIDERGFRCQLEEETMKKQREEKSSQRVVES